MIDHNHDATTTPQAPKSTAPHYAECPMSNNFYVQRGYDVFGRKLACWCDVLGKMEKPNLQATSGLPIPGETERYPAITATKRFDPLSRITWLEFSGKPCEDLRKNLRDLGWRFSGFRVQYRNNRRWPTEPDAAHFNITYEDDGECHYAEERADRLDARAEKHGAEAHNRFEAAHNIGSMIPFGQPILVGHHSEGRHRRDIAKIDNNMRKGSEAFRTAERLESRAESSRRHQAYIQSTPVLYRRKQRLEAELRGFERNLAKYPHLNTSAEYLERVQRVRSEIADLAQKIADAGGIPADSLDAQKGDIVRIDRHRARVVRVNKKTYTVDLIDGPFLANGEPWQMKYDKSELQEVIERASDTAASQQQSAI